MERFHRYYRLHQVLSSARHPVPRSRLEEALECRRATIFRVIDSLRACGFPIEYSREGNGWRYKRGVAVELPGIWFNSSEIYALLAAQKLLSEAEPGLLAETFEPLRRKLDAILASEHLGGGELPGRVRIVSIGRRGSTPHFRIVAAAIMQRKRLRIEYQSRTHDHVTLREISAQRLVHYRDNWYVDAWCHTRKALRIFALDRIRDARTRRTACREISDAALDSHFSTAYGIFSGEPTELALLRFTAGRARWVADEQWHPQQRDRLLDDGALERTVPYADPRELIMDILKYGPDVEVVGPEHLRAQIAQILAAASARYAAK